MNEKKKSLIWNIFRICFLLFVITVSFRLLGVMLVLNKADVRLESQACPMKLSVEGLCVVSGSLTHNLLGEAEITRQDGSLLIVDRNSVKGVTYLDGDSYYRPFGKVFAGVFLTLFWLVCLAIAFVPFRKIENFVFTPKR